GLRDQPGESMQPAIYEWWTLPAGASPCRGRSAAERGEHQEDGHTAGALGEPDVIAPHQQDCEGATSLQIDSETCTFGAIPRLFQGLAHRLHFRRGLGLSSALSFQFTSDNQPSYQPSAFQPRNSADSAL